MMSSLLIAISVILYYCESAGRNYFILDGDYINGDAANRACKNAGYQLATIVDQDDRDAVDDAFTNQGINPVEPPERWSMAYWWIGLTDNGTEGEWIWRDGTQCGTQTNLCIDYWYPSAFVDAPRTGYLDCAMITYMLGDGSMQALDWDCEGDYAQQFSGYHFGAICQETATKRRRKKVQVDIDCDTVRGDTVLGAGDISRAKCPKRTTLVSCGIDGWHGIGGTRVRPSKDGVCQAELSDAVTSQQPYGVAAVANCCRFPLAAGVEAITKLSGSGRKVEAKCPNPSSLTGCTVDYDSGTTNNIKGSYAGKAVIAKVERPTRNTCTGQAKDKSTDVVAGAQCIKLNNDKYDLDCMAVTKYGTRDDMTEANTCPTDYQLLSCMTYTTTLTLDDWHIQDGPVCYVQQDNYDEQYANGVCCKLMKTVIVDEYGEEEIDYDEVRLVDPNVVVAGGMEEFIGDNMELIGVIGLIVVLLMVAFYKWCYKKEDGGYKKLSTSDDDALLSKVQVY